MTSKPPMPSKSKRWKKPRRWLPPSEQESKNRKPFIKAKGFADCVVYIEGENCNVVVKADSLQPQQTIQITEIVTAQSKIVAQNIKISNVNS